MRERREALRRGNEEGTVGYSDFGGSMDTCIAMRTIVITPAQKRQNVETAKRQDVATPSVPRPSGSDSAKRQDLETPSEPRPAGSDSAERQDIKASKRRNVGTSEGRWRVDAQVGAGIVADSEPSNEYQETVNKAQAMLNALNLANSWLESSDAQPADTNPAD